MGSSRNNRNEKNPMSDRDLKQSDKGEFSVFARYWRNDQSVENFKSEQDTHKKDELKK